MAVYEAIQSAVVSVTNVSPLSMKYPDDFAGCKQRNAGVFATRRREGAEDLYLQENVVSRLQVEPLSSFPNKHRESSDNLQPFPQGPSCTDLDEVFSLPMLSRE